jgi:superoxide dismutase
MTPNGKEMSEGFKDTIQKSFGSIQNFQETFIAKAASNFGS